MKCQSAGFNTQWRQQIELRHVLTCFLGVGGAEEERASARFLRDLRPRILTSDMSSPESVDSWSLLLGFTPRAAEAVRFFPFYKKSSTKIRVALRPSILGWENCCMLFCKIYLCSMARRSALSTFRSRSLSQQSDSRSHLKDKTHTKDLTI